MNNEKEKAGKKPRIWDLGGTNKDLENLERTVDKPVDSERNFTLNTEVREIKISVTSCYKL